MHLDSLASTDVQKHVQVVKNVSRYQFWWMFLIKIRIWKPIIKRKNWKVGITKENCDEWNQRPFGTFIKMWKKKLANICKEKKVPLGAFDTLPHIIRFHAPANGNFATLYSPALGFLAELGVKGAESADEETNDQTGWVSTCRDCLRKVSTSHVVPTESL